MISRIRDRLGPAGFVLAIVALVAALGGGAYAASGGLNGKQKKEVKKIAKNVAKHAAKRGPAGPQGPAGANGKDGSNGANGEKGDKGDPGTPGTNGTNGTDGTNGKNVEVGTATSEECGEGGVTVQVAGEPSTKKAVCNGSSASASSTLQPGQTETGTWRFVGNGATEQSTSISFPTPLAPADAEIIVIEKFNYEQEPTTGSCTGTAEHPTAEPGVLCIYESPFESSLLGVPNGVYPPFSKKKIEEIEGEGSEPYVAQGVGTAGALLYFENQGTKTASGSFAITAPLAG